MTARNMRQPYISLSVVAICAVILVLRTLPANASEVLTKSGFRLIGQLGKISSVDERPNIISADSGKQIFIFDDGLRRTYVSIYQLRMEETFLEGDATQGQRIRIQQRVARQKKGIGSLQSTLNVTPFDVYGRRIYSIMAAGQGRLDISQGITEITPVYTRIDGLVDQKNTIEWDMRVATSTIPRETLSQILRNRPESNSPEGRLEVVRLLFAAERFEDARRELVEGMKQFPSLQEMSDLRETLRQKSATLLLDHIKRLRDNGQHQQVKAYLAGFPSEGIAGITLVEIRDLLLEYEKTNSRIERTLTNFRSLADSVPDAQSKKAIDDLYAEGQAVVESDIDTVERFTDFERGLDDPALTPDRHLANAISGWLVGTGNTTDNITVATSMIEVRDLVARYLRSKNPGERETILQQIGRLEGGTPNYVAQILRQMRPPIETPAQADKPLGQYRIDVPLKSGEKLTYDIQLPSEYSPYRRYPTIVSLHGATSTPESHLDWWCGQPVQLDDSVRRLGQATFRRGYIVITPHWAKPNQRYYRYLESEHLAVLATFRDALRRFSIDVDRVYLSGYSMGGDAAWDIGLSHPDFWAGIIPISATADQGADSSPKYVSLYWPQAMLVPTYFVIGELDPDRIRLNKRDFDRYLKNPGFDMLLVEYRGRGHEGFYDEINRIFDWMELHPRTLRTDEFECVTKRASDNFFWCAEIDQLPSGTLVHPIDWPQDSAGKVTTISFKKNPNVKNLLEFKTGAAKLTAYLSPEWVDFGDTANIRVNGKSAKYDLVPNIRDMLEDVRQRGDRVYPFWLKLDLPTGNRAS
ncbi:MAG: hypothetical protein KDB27_33250 [Planctomycetales bacterium]|nr:hypothetical protein [Planctomycetales bacterium]